MEMDINTKKIRLIQYLFEQIFKAVDKSGLKKIVISNLVDDGRGGKRNELIECLPMPTSKALRGYDGDAFGVKFRIVEQEPNKSSWCAELAKQGHQCCWVFDRSKTGNEAWLSFIIKIDNEIKIFSAAEAKNEVTAMMRKKEAASIEQQIPVEVVDGTVLFGGMDSEAVEAAVGDLFDTMKKANEAVAAGARKVSELTVGQLVDTTKMDAIASRMENGEMDDVVAGVAEDALIATGAATAAAGLLDIHSDIPITGDVEGPEFDTNDPGPEDDGYQEFEY